MHEKSLQSVRDFDKYATTGESFYIAKVVRYYPFETITKSYFDYDLKQNDRDYIESIMEDLKKMFKVNIDCKIKLKKKSAVKITQFSITFAELKNNENR